MSSTSAVKELATGPATKILKSGLACGAIGIAWPPVCRDTVPNGAWVEAVSSTWLPFAIWTLIRLASDEVLVAIIRAGRMLLQMIMLSGMLPCNVHEDRAFETVAVNGVPGVPRIRYEVSGGPLGVFPTLPEKPPWSLLQDATDIASAAASAVAPRICRKFLFT